jgi:hypothetical protein
MEQREKLTSIINMVDPNMFLEVGYVVNGLIRADKEGILVVTKVPILYIIIYFKLLFLKNS